MNISQLGITAAALGLLVTTAAPMVNADQVPGESQDTKTQVSIIDTPAPDPANLKLIHVPDQYNFETKLQASGQYSLDGGVIEKDGNITVFNDKSIQDWSVKASIDDTKLVTDSGKIATVTNFKINGQDLMGQNANQVVYQSETNKTIENNTGNMSKEVKKEGLSISLNNEKHDLKSGDVLKGKVNYQLFNTPSAK